MKDYIELDSTPCNEDCVQVGPDYDGYRLRREAHAHANQMRRMFGPEPDGARFSVKVQNGGEYAELVIHFDTDKPASFEYALKCEGEGPENWDADALRELGQHYPEFLDRL